MLQACSSGPNFPQFSASQQEQNKEQARIIIFRGSQLQGYFSSYDVKIDDKVIGSLSDGSFLVANHPEGSVKITKVNDFLTKDFDFSINVVAGKTYYLEFEMNGTTVIVGGGIFIPVINRAQHPQYCSPGICAGLQDAAEALPKLRNLTRGSQP